MKGRNTVGHYKGQDYYLQHDRLCDVLVVESKALAWHLWFDFDNGERFYEGNFPTKREAINHIEKTVTAETKEADHE